MTGAKAGIAADGASAQSSAARTRALTAGCVFVYAGLAVLVYWGISPLDGRHLPVCGCLDPVQSAWFLKWDVTSLWHGHDPFFSAAIDYPRGIDVADNTSMPLLALLGAPVTALLGPVSSVNLWLHLAFFTSAWAALWVLRRWALSLGAAFVGGLFYGFSPYLIGQGAGHVNLAFVPLLPVLVYLCSELLRGRSARPRRTALILGVVAAAQFLISAEILADSAVLTVISVVLLALVHPRGIWRNARRAVRATAWALASFVPLAAAELWALLFGAQHITGKVSPEVAKGLVRADLLAPVVPDRLMRVGSAGAIREGSTFVMGNLLENGSYLGVPLLLVVVGLVVWARRDRRVIFAAAMAVVAFVLSLGNTLTVDGRATSFALPFRLLMQLPQFANITAARFSAFTDLALAGVLGFGLDLLWRRDGLGRAGERADEAAAELAPHPTRGRPWRGVLAFGIVAAALVPLVPRVPYPVSATSVPAFFTSSAVDVIPADGLVLAYPYPYSPTDQAMLWQADAGFRFSLLGGYALAPSPHGGGTYNPPSPVPASLRQFFRSGLSARPVTFSQLFVDPHAVETAACSFFRADHVSAVVIDPDLSMPIIWVQRITVRTRPDAGLALQLMRTITGEAPRSSGGVDLWLDPASHCRVR